ncbi:MAG: NUDIX hydrolase, partial [Calothrix sp. SM1_5_4]|nr:NUDIX hydrolase [Calothrix sp. SM1_5_4]
GEAILVRQHRHGAGSDFLELPGGSADSHSEDPREAGRRELLEETGYEAAEWIYCGYHFPNPALQANKMHTFVALGCRKIAEPRLDPFEDLHVVRIPLAEAVGKWINGEFKHSLISASFGMTLKTLRERGLIGAELIGLGGASPVDRG